MRLFNFVLCFVLVLFVISCSKTEKQEPKAVKGVLDLRGWDFEKDGIVRLDGDWEFYWKQFLKSADFDTVKTKHYIPVPKPWNGYKWGNEELGYEGYATYRLRILVNNKTKDFGLKFPDQGTAFELYLNDSLVGMNGKIGKSRETSEPQYKPLLIPFDRTGDTITLVCKVSNYDFHFGGIYFAIKIGNEDKINIEQRYNYLSDYIISALFIFCIAILLLFFVLMPQDKISLYFLLLSFFSFLRTITVNERIINEFLPFLSWEWGIKLEAFSWMLEAPILTYCIILIFKYKSLIKIAIAQYIFYYGIVLITLFTPANINTQFLIIGQLISGLIMIFWISIMIFAISKKKENSIILLLGLIPFISAGYNEVLYYTNIVPQLIINFPTGSLIYVFSWIIVLAKRFQSAFKRVENYAKDLEVEVNEKTKELREEKEKSEQLLLNVLPDQIAERLKQGEQPIADHFDEASVIFIDIVDFTKISSKSTPQKMVNMLNNVFTEFDKIAEKYGLEKIKTIGDCYMAAAGIPIHRPDHAEAIARMAIESMKTMNGFITEDGHEIKFRVGLDCGPIVAGVIGKQKFIYDLWGDMVNTASRMETNGIIGRIQCTERFKNKLGMRSEELGIRMEERGEIEVKGKGMMKTYFIN